MQALSILLAIVLFGGQCSMKSFKTVSTVVRLGDVAYYMHNIPRGINDFGEGQVVEPCTVIRISKPDLTADFLQEVIARFSRSDDVWSTDFLASIVFQHINSGLHVQSDAEEIIKSWNISQVYYSQLSDDDSACPEGPYFLNSGKLYDAYRLYPDTSGAFIVATVEDEAPFTYKALDAAAYGEEHPSALTVAVPSRLRFTKTRDKPFAGVRIGVKDIMDLKGLKTGGSSRAYTQLYGKRTQNAVFVQKLLELGFIAIGKMKTTQFADSEWPTCDYIDYHGPFNPRGDGYLTPSGSSSGSAAAVASYDWIDFALGTDTLGSIRAPAAAQGLYGMRPSLGAASFSGIIPYSPRFDTPAGLARDAKSFAALSRAMYGFTDQPACQTKPIRLLYPTEYWPVSHSESQQVFEAFISKFEKFLGVQRTAISLEEIWKDTSPENIHTSMSEYFENVFDWVANPDQWTGFYRDFLQEYEETHGKQAVVNPQLRFKRQYLPTVTAEQQEEGIRQLELYQKWFYTHIMPPAKGGCSDALIVLPWTMGEPDFRDRYRDGPQKFTGEGFFFYNIGPYAEAPEYIVPAGTTSYHSPLTNQEERLPAAIGIIAAKGCDIMLTDLIYRMMTETEDIVAGAEPQNGFTKQIIISGQEKAGW